jgi:hypothetical protein
MILNRPFPLVVQDVKGKTLAIGVLKKLFNVPAKPHAVSMQAGDSFCGIQWKSELFRFHENADGTGHGQTMQPGDAPPHFLINTNQAKPCPLPITIPLKFHPNQTTILRSTYVAELGILPR